MESHVTVLSAEAVEALNIGESSTIVDATFGAGGHARLITQQLGPKGTFVGIDTDKDAFNPKVTKEFQAKKCTTHLHVGNFRDINSILKQLNIEEADGILADLGWRMEQFSGNGRGFSFMVDEPLLMTLGDPKQYVFTARDIVNDWSEQDLSNVFKGYGEERFARHIARSICSQREVAPIETTFALVEAVKAGVPTRFHHGRIHPATKVFQALRIAVNDEFEALEEFIKHSIALLKPHGRLAIISFHSLEDRIVKHLFRNLTHDHIGTLVNKKPITATDEELTQNPRSRSAKLRIFQKT